jgi:hypothetical protein
LSPATAPPKTGSPGCQQRCFQRGSLQFRVRARKQDRVHVVARIGQVLPNAFATRQAGCRSRSQTYRAMDRYNGALADFNRAIDPSDEDYAAKRTDLYRLMGQGADAWPEPSGSEPLSAN